MCKELERLENVCKYLLIFVFFKRIIHMSKHLQIFANNSKDLQRFAQMGKDLLRFANMKY